MRSIFETLQPDLPYRVRQRFSPWITRFARTLGQPEYRLRDTEYVGTVKQPLDEFTETPETRFRVGPAGVVSPAAGRIGAKR